MKYRKFGSTDLLTSEVGFGAWAIGGPVMAGNIPIGWGDVEDKTSISAMKKARDLGINFYDTADFYGLGHSESLIGNLWGNDSHVIIASKVGHRLDKRQNIYLDYSKDYVIQACEESLRRLKRETIDFYQLHAAKLVHLQNGECIQAMEQLKHQGKIRHWGISLHTYDPEPEAEYILGNNTVSRSIPTAAGFQLVFNIINQKALPIINKASENGIGIIARMPFQFGLLTRKFHKATRFSSSDHRSIRLPPHILEQTLEDLESLWPIASKYNIGYDSFALSFILSHPGVSTVIPGIKTPEQAKANAKNSVTIHKSDLETLHHLFEWKFKHSLLLMKEQG